MHQTVTLATYEKIFRQYYAELCLYANTIVKNETQAEEIVQELFVKLWQKRKQLIINDEPKKYLIKAVKNNSLMWIRQRLKQVELEANEIDKVFAVASVAEENLSAEEIAKIYQQTMDTIPPRWREIFHLIRNEGLKYKEAALKLNISVKTIEKAMGKTLKLFRQNLTEYAR